LPYSVFVDIAENHVFGFVAMAFLMMNSTLRGNRIIPLVAMLCALFTNSGVQAQAAVSPPVATPNPGTAPATPATTSAAQPGAPVPVATPVTTAPAAGETPNVVASAPSAPPSLLSQLKGSTSCFLSPLAENPATVAAFKNAPQDILKTYPDGGSRMTSAVRGLAGTDIETLPMLMQVSRSATPVQTAAIGAGLAQTARACVRQRPDIAQIIQQTIVLADFAPLTTAFLASSGNIETAAAGGGGAAAGGAAAAGGIGGTASGGDTNGAGGGVANQPLSLGITRSRANASFATFGAGGSTIIFNTLISGGSVSPVQ
jgi:hypothetical protein